MSADFSWSALTRRFSGPFVQGRTGKVEILSRRRFDEVERVAPTLRLGKDLAYLFKFLTDRFREPAAPLSAAVEKGADRFDTPCRLEPPRLEVAIIEVDVAEVGKDPLRTFRLRRGINEECRQRLDSLPECKRCDPGIPIGLNEGRPHGFVRYLPIPITNDHVEDRLITHGWPVSRTES